MASNQSMLEQVLQAALSGGGLRGQEAGGQGAPAPGGNIGDVLGSLLGAAAGGIAANRPGAGGAGGLGDILGSLLGGGQATSGSAAGTGAAQGQADPSKSGAGLARYGGMAVIGVLAYQALKRFQAQQAGQKEVAAAQAPPPDSGFHPSQAPGGADAVSGVLVKAMVAAAQADGVIDEDEQSRLAGRLDQLGMSSADRGALIQQLRTPVDPQELVDAATSPELALQIYAASALAVKIDSPTERSYLDRLANDLGVDPGLKAQVEQSVGRG
jgi:uncharacterized membrane protein YebE (DUF533 family)